MVGVPRWQPRLDEDCAKAKPHNEQWQCMLGYHAFPYLTTPSFVFQYRFDAAQLVCVVVDKLTFLRAMMAWANLTLPRS